MLDHMFGDLAVEGTAKGRPLAHMTAKAFNIFRMRPLQFPLPIDLPRNSSILRNVRRQIVGERVRGSATRVPSLQPLRLPTNHLRRYMCCGLTNNIVSTNSRVAATGNSLGRRSASNTSRT